MPYWVVITEELSAWYIKEILILLIQVIMIHLIGVTELNTIAGIRYFYQIAKMFLVIICM